MIPQRLKFDLKGIQQLIKLEDVNHYSIVVNGLGFEDNATYEPCCAQPGARARGSLVFDIEADSALSAQGRCALSTEAASPIEPQGEFVGPGP